jgi:hypothetical protein
MPDDLNTDNIGELHGRPHAVKPNGSAKPGGEIDDDLGGFEAESEHPNVLDDAEEIRLDPNQEIHESVKVLGPVPIRMTPGKQVFFRVKPGDDWRWTAVMYAEDQELGPFIVAKAMWNMVEDTRPFVILTCITSKNVEFFWPVPLPREDDNAMSREWGASKRRAAALAETRWLKVKSNQPAGTWDTFVSKGERSEPEWSGRTFKEMFDSAFGDKIIRDVSHPVVKRQQGL